MLKKIFRKTSLIEEFYSPMNGDLLPLENVPDPVFSEKMMGDGVAIIPRDGLIVSPVNGKVEHVFPTKHAIGIKSVNGLEILIHVGLETVNLQGEGFEVLVDVNQQVQQGDPLLKVDINLLEERHKEIITPMIITNFLEKVVMINLIKQGEVTPKDILFTCELK